MKSKIIKTVGWLSILLGAFVILFSEYILGHWPVTAFLSDNPSDAERVIWATDATIVISMAGVLICSAGMWFLSTWPGPDRAHWIAFVASPICVWSLIWWILGGRGIVMTVGTTTSWWVQDCLTAAFLIFGMLIPTKGRQTAFGIASVLYLVVCLMLLALSLCTQNERWARIVSW